jgi:hypothetical protein
MNLWQSKFEDMDAKNLGYEKAHKTKIKLSEAKSIHNIKC